ncbi:MAG: hypothetical protein ABIG60_01065 [Patescibacteria group bacterium]
MGKYLKENYIYSFLLLIALISLFGAIIYRIYALNKLGIILGLSLALFVFIIVQIFLFAKYKIYLLSYHNKFNDYKKETKQIVSRLPNISLVLGYFLLFILNFYLLYKSQTTEAIISPWQVIPNYFFLAYALATAFLLIILIKKIKFSLLLISLHYFLSFSIALFIYKIGYGFDPFIHQATVDLIAKTGEVLPKPFYYLGQYSLIVILHKITSLSLIWLDKLLVPVLASVFLPLVLFNFLKKWFKDTKSLLIILLTLLILPFTPFILTTPQNLSYLFLILTVFCGLTCLSKVELTITYLFAFTTLAIHPIAGIPALLFSLAITVYHSDKNKLKKYLYLLIYFFTIFSLPLAFYFINLSQVKSDNTLNLEPGAAKKILIPNEENIILNFIYLYGFNIKTLISFLIIIGIIIAFRYRKNCKIFFINLGLALSLIVSYFITKKLSFDFLIYYERNNFSERILLIAIIFLLPFIIITLYSLINKIFKQPAIIKIIWFSLVIILITTSLYFSYPRFDRYYNSRGYSTSSYDIEAVHWIDTNANSDYIVLANQQVSAAALKEFGFKKYYSYPLLNKERGARGEVFYYPIPTSSPLYQYYLDIVYEKPSRDTIKKAMDLTGVNEAYFVLNKYWWAFPKILEEAKLEADSWQKIGQGNVYIFKYSKE